MRRKTRPYEPERRVVSFSASPARSWAHFNDGTKMPLRDYYARLRKPFTLTDAQLRDWRAGR